MSSREGSVNNNPDVVSLYIGLGPAAPTISKEQIRERLEKFAPVSDIRVRGRCAFVDVSGAEAAEKIINALNGEYIGEARMVVQHSRGNNRDMDRDRERPRERERDRYRDRGRGALSDGRSGGDGSGGRTALFVGLGPCGRSISDRELRSKLEEAAPIIGFRRRGECAFIDVQSPSHARRMIEMMHNQYMGDCRLSVQQSREGKRGRSNERVDRHRRRSDSRDRRRRSRRGRDRTRSRSRSPRSSSRGRRRLRRSRSGSHDSSRSSYSRRSSEASVESRGYRKRDRRRRERSRSVSSGSRSASETYRKRRD